MLRSRAIEGVVPAEALTVGIQDEADVWWEAFANEVVEDARARGYVQPTWRTRGVELLFLAGAIAALSAVLYWLGPDSPIGRVAFGVGFAVCFVAP